MCFVFPRVQNSLCKPHRRTTMSLHLLTTNLVGSGWCRWHSWSFLDSCASQLRWQPINLHINSRSKEYFWVAGIRTILRMSQIQTGCETYVFHSPFPSSVTSAGPQGDPTWGPASVPHEDKSISLVIPGGQDAFSNSGRLGYRNYSWSPANLGAPVSHTVVAIPVYDNAALCWQCCLWIWS